MWFFFIIEYSWRVKMELKHRQQFILGIFLHPSIGPSTQCWRCLSVIFTRQLYSIIKENYMSYSHICITKPRSTVVFEFCTFQMSKSGIRRKHKADAIQLRRISHPASHPYKKGPHVRGNGASTQDALEDKIQWINHTAEDQTEGLPGGVGRPLGSAELGLQDVQVHFEEE